MDFLSTEADASDAESAPRSRSGSPAGSARSGSRSPPGSHRSRSRSRAKSGSRSRSRSGSRSRAVSQAKSGSRSRSGSQAKSGSRSRSGSRAKSGSRSRSGSRAKSGSRSRSGSRAKSGSRSRSGSRAKSGSRSRSRSGSRSRSRSPSKSGTDGEGVAKKRGSRSRSGSKSGSDIEGEVGKKAARRRSGSAGSGAEEGEAKKQKKKRKMVMSDDDEEDDEEGLDEDLKDLIDDGPEEVDGDVSEDEERKRKHDDSELEEDLSDEDFALIEENLGVRINRKKKKKLKRVVMGSDDEGEADKEDKDDRAMIEDELFDSGDEAGSVAAGTPARQEPDMAPRGEDFGDLGNLEASDEESDPDDFIVDEEGQPISKTKKKHPRMHADAALQEAQDIFGVDFDFDEFDYGEEDLEEDEEDEDYDEEEVERRKLKKKEKKRPAKTTIFDVFEPSELERGHFTDLDQEIRMTDTPERFQLRNVPVTAAEEAELEQEAKWIWKGAFTTAPISQQDYWESGEFSERSGQRSTRTIDKIQEALKFMRNQQFEVPFIAFYRKEYVEPELNINDLWKIYAWDEKWVQLRSRKKNVLKLIDQMQQYQFDQIDPDKPLESHIRALTEDDSDRVKDVQTMEELKDCYSHFLLYYGPDIPKMKNAQKAKVKREKDEERKARQARRQEQGEEGAAEEHVEDEVEEEEQRETLKQASRKSGYNLCQAAGLAELARKMGLSPEQFGENLRDNYQRNEVEQDPAEPHVLADEFINSQFRTTDDVIKGAVHMVAMQIAHDPTVRRCVRQTFVERAIVNSHPTKKGVKEVDEQHPCYVFKYLKNKPINTLTNDQFVRLVQAETDGLLKFNLHIDHQVSHGGPTSYFEEIISLYHRDEFSDLAQEWNNLRSQAVRRALDMIVYVQLIKELRSRLTEEAKEHVMRSCCTKLYNWLRVAPYQPEQQMDDDDDLDTSRGLRSLGIAYSNDRDAVAFGALVDGNGDVTDFIRLPHILHSKTSWRAKEKEGKLFDLKQLKDFLEAKKPHVVAVGAECRNASRIVEDLQEVVKELEEESSMAPIAVELMDNEVARVYAGSRKAENDFREYPALLRQAVSLARRMQDPLQEFCGLCNPDEDILSLKYHPLMADIDKEMLLGALQLEFVNRVNEVGVDVNKCVEVPYVAPLVQFVCGLGPRKGYHLLKLLKQNNSQLENRTQLVTMCNMGPKVFINCAGFVKIDTNSLGESTEAYVEVLDGSRVHPETYEWARKMAVDALEYDDTADDANPAGALEEILESPERLKDLDLDAFAEELERQDYGNKHITLYDIRAELNHRYKDLRTPYRSPTQEERFNMLTKESPLTFYIGKLVLCSVNGIAHKRPLGDQLDQANPQRNEETGSWQCPFCKKSDFPELSEVWNHFDAGDCPGQATGVRARLDSGITGFIPLRYLSDKHVTSPEDRVTMKMTLHCRIMKINIERFTVDLTCRSSDLVDKEGKWKLPKDHFYDYDAEERDTGKEEEKKKQASRQTYTKRVIAHPAFHNIDYKACERLMTDMDMGDAIIRPSSKGSDHLTLTWKVADGILAHVDVREAGKENAFSLGSSLIIEEEQYEDLDEILARYVQPTAALAREIINYRYYHDSEGGKREILDKVLTTEKRKQPSRIPYYFSTTKEFAGKFLLAYMPKRSAKYEYVTVTPDGLRYRQTMFPGLSHLVKWFKEHFRDPIPGTPAMSLGAYTPGDPMFTPGRTPGMAGSRTPGRTPAQGSRTPAMGSRTPGRTPAAGSRTPGYLAPGSRTPGYTAPGSRTPGSRTPGYVAPGSRTPSYGSSTPGGVFGSAAQAASRQFPGNQTPGRAQYGTQQAPSMQYGSQTPSRPYGSQTPSRQQFGVPTPSRPYGAQTPSRQQFGAPAPAQSYVDPFAAPAPYQHQAQGFPYQAPPVANQASLGFPPTVAPPQTAYSVSRQGGAPAGPAPGAPSPSAADPIAAMPPPAAKPAPAVAVDWAKAAEMWRKQQETSKGGSSTRTPRTVGGGSGHSTPGNKTPMRTPNRGTPGKDTPARTPAKGTPAQPAGTPGGDGTPLFDER